MTDEREIAAATTRDPRPALFAAAAVLAYLIVRSLVGLIGWTPGSGVDVGMMSYFGREAVLSSLPLAVGVFLLLWLVPVRPRDRLLLIVAKGLLAALAGVTLAELVGFAFAGIQAGLGVLRDLPHLTPIALPAQIVSGTVAAAPVVILAVLLVHLVGRGERS